jgi:hypothetical protein
LPVDGESEGEKNDSGELENEKGLSKFGEGSGADGGIVVVVEG